MRFPVDNDHLFHPLPISLLAMRLRLWLLGSYTENAAERDMTTMPDRPSGLRLRTAEVRRALGIGGANDARRLRAAVDELHGDPIFLWVEMSGDGRALAFEVVDAIHRVEYMARFTLLAFEDVLAPPSRVDLHLALRHAAVRRMKAPALNASAHDIAAIAGPGRPADLRWVRRTLLPATVRLSARIKGSVFASAIWSAPDAAPAVKMRFGGPNTVWTPTNFEKVRPLEWAWRATPSGVTELRRPAASPIFRNH